MIIVKELLEIPPNQKGEAFLHWMASAGHLVESLKCMMSGLLTSDHLLLKNNDGNDPLIRCFKTSKEDLSSICSVKWARLFKTSEDILKIKLRIVEICRSSEIPAQNPVLLTNLDQAFRIKRNVEINTDKLRTALSQISNDTFKGRRC